MNERAAPGTGEERVGRRERQRGKEGQRKGMPNAAERLLALDKSCTGTAEHARRGKQQQLHKPLRQGGQGRAEAEARHGHTPQPH
eukprot:4420208-Pyramimonas_sp.AAC.1